MPYAAVLIKNIRVRIYETAHLGAVRPVAAPATGLAEVVNQQAHVPGHGPCVAQTDQQAARGHESWSDICFRFIERKCG
jgi:hypothetical protein